MVGETFIQGRLGDDISFSGVNVFDTYNADCIEMKPLGATIENDYANNVGMSSFKLYRQKVKLHTLEMSFYVSGDSEEALQISISQLMAKAQNCVIRNANSNFEYPAILTSVEDEDTGVEFYHKVTLTFAAIKRMKLQTKTFTETSTFYNPGTIESGMRIAATFSSVGDSVVNVNGYFLSNVISGIPFVIDGIEGTVKQNDVNRIQDTNIARFPKVQPGWNTISVPDGCTAEVSWYPTYI